MTSVGLQTGPKPALSAMRFAAWTLTLPLGSALTTTTIISFDSDLWLLLLPEAFLLLIWVICMVIAVCAAALSRKWWNAALLSAAIVAAVPATVIAARGDAYIHLVAMLPSYARQTSSTEQTMFDWGCSGFAGAGASCDTLIHDPTDRILTEKITSGIRGNPDRMTVRHLLGHYYLVTAHA
jgi:hypothetical protein